MTSLADLLFAPEGDPPLDDVVVVDDDGDTTRRALVDHAERVASELRDAGATAGTAVALRMRDGAPLVAAMFGVWRANAVLVPVNPRLTADEVDRLVEAVRPVAMFDQNGARPLSEPERSARYDTDIALVQMTSGTTGRPKPLLLRHSGVLELMDGVIRKIRAGSAKKRDASRSSRPVPNLIPVSLSLWAGIYNVLFAFRVGAPVVVMNGFTTARFAQLVHEHHITSTVLPPAAMTMLSDDETITDLAPLRFVRSITAPLSPLQARRFHDKFGVAILNSYGQTELGGEVIGWNASDSREFGASKLGAVGRPHDGVQARIDESTGELQLRTPAMSAGYADGADITDRLTADGWFRTGDIGRIDDDGFVWIDGRVSDMINRGGLKVFPAEVEECIRSSSQVSEVAVVGVSDDRLGEVPVAFVVLREGAELDPDALDALCRAHLAPYKVPVRYEVVPELPRNEVGKVLTRDLATRVRAT